MKNSIKLIFIAMFVFVINSGFAEQFSYPDSWGKQGFTLEASKTTSVSINYSLDKFSIDDIAITPLGIPMLAGPGSITNAIVLMQDAQGFENQLVLPIAIFMVMLITLLTFLGASSIIKFIGETGNKIMLKLMGLIMMVIAVEFFFAGLKPILRDIFLIG